MENNNSNGISIAALVCGIVGIIGSFFTVIPAIDIIALIIAIAGIILGAIGMKKANEMGIMDNEDPQRVVSRAQMAAVATRIVDKLSK